MANNYWKAMMIQENNRKRWLKANPNLNEDSGIYILTRVDENGLKFAYIGQAKHILTRLAQHLAGYQHIDLSLKKHKLYNDKNPYGWKVDYFNCLENELNGYEQEYILKYANLGYQLRNKTSGSQGKGKVGISDEQTTKGYRDGLRQGYKNAIKDVKEYFDKYLMFDYKNTPDKYKKGWEIKEIYKRKYNEFKELLEGKDDNREDTKTDC